MMKHWLALTGFVLAVALGVACEDDIICDCLDPDPVQGYLEPTTRTAVLNNFELSYRNRHLDRCVAVLDEGFTFYFFSGDVGGDIPAHWGRQDEIDATYFMFDPNYVDENPSNGIQEPLKKIFFDLKWEAGVVWQQVPHESETWFSTVVFYNFQFDVGENDHLINNPGSKAQFTVRNAGTGEAPHWQLVEVRDLDQDLPLRSSAPEAATWGQVKALYHPGRLETLEGVLGDIERAYNDRDIASYEAALDDSFTFYFTPGDVGGGLPSQWGRQDDVDANRNLFDVNYVDPDGLQGACTNIWMDLIYNETGVEWQVVPQDNGETWYTTTVFYNFQFDIGDDFHLISNPGAKAQFTVRNAGTDVDPDWQLVKLRDLGGLTVRAGTSAATVQSTWGSVKYLYR